MEGKFEMATRSEFQNKNKKTAIKSSIGAQNASMNKPFRTQENGSVTVRFMFPS